MVAALALGLTFVAVDVVGEGTCPAPADVGRALANLVPAPAGPAGEHHSARLSRTERGIHLALHGARGESLAERDLASDGGCDGVAAAIAVIIATWEADLDPRLSARVKLPPPPPRPMPATVAIAASVAPPAASPPPSFDLGLGLLASLSGGQLAPGARIDGRVAPAGRRLGLGVGVAGVTARSAPVGDRAEAARWSRIAFGAGPDLRFALGRTNVDLRAQALAALLQVSGVGLTTNTSGSTAQLGAGVGVHVGRPWGTATPWIGLDLQYWPGPDRLEISGVADRGQLPRLELQLAVGLSLGRFP